MCFSVSTLLGTRNPFIFANASHRRVSTIFDVRKEKLEAGLQFRTDNLTCWNSALSKFLFAKEKFLQLFGEDTSSSRVLDTFLNEAEHREVAAKHVWTTVWRYRIKQTRAGGSASCFLSFVGHQAFQHWNVAVQRQRFPYVGARNHLPRSTNADSCTTSTDLPTAQLLRFPKLRQVHSQKTKSVNTWPLVEVRR